MLHDSTQRLILKLCEMTGRGEIAWREGAGGSGETSAYETEGYTVEVRVEPPGLRILRADGREVERADTDDLEATPWPSGEETFSAHVKAMAVRAHRVARGAEAAIASILSALSAPARKVATPPTEAAAAQPPPRASQNASVEAEPANPVVAMNPQPTSPVRVMALSGSHALARRGPSFGAINSFARPAVLAARKTTASGQPTRPAPAPADAYKPWA
jgi:hypothetical protein